MYGGEFTLTGGTDCTLRIAMLARDISEFYWKNAWDKTVQKNTFHQSKQFNLLSPDDEPMEWQLRLPNRAVNLSRTKTLRSSEKSA